MGLIEKIHKPGILILLSWDSSEPEQLNRPLPGEHIPMKKDQLSVWRDTD